MSKRFTDYDEAYEYARTQSDKLSMDHGIMRQKEYGRDGFNVSILPPPDRSFGHELRAERVTPGMPRCK